MDIRTIMTNGSAAAAVRLILLVLAAIGFVAMHGVAATDPATGHHSPMDMPLPTHDAMAAVAVLAEPIPGGASHEHDEMAACVFVLLTVLAGVALHALQGRLGEASPAAAAAVRERRGAPRAPPRPIFLCLCVFRL